MCPLYVAGLIGLGDRKSVQPMAARGDGVPYDRLYHFIAAGIWDEMPLQQALLGEADRFVGGADAILVVDDTVVPKTCLAHLARDVAYAVETSDDPVPWRQQLWLRSVFALAERVTDLATSTLAAKRRSLDRQFGAILATPSG